MSRIVTLTEPIARAIAQDAANKQMRNRIRHTLEPAIWNEDDYNLACETIDRIWVQPLIQAYQQSRES